MNEHYPEETMDMDPDMLVAFYGGKDRVLEFTDQELVNDPSKLRAFQWVTTGWGEKAQERFIEKLSQYLDDLKLQALLDELGWTVKK